MSESTELMWRDFSRANASNPAQRHRWRLVLREVGAHLPSGPPIVADLGCGSGVLLSIVRRAVPGAHCVGLDIEPRALEMAQRAVADGEFHRADLSTGTGDIPESLMNRVDIAICSEVLEHLDQPEAALRLARRLLRPGGVFIATVPGGSMTGFDKAIGHVRHYDLETLTSLLQSSGFRVTRAFHWGFPFHTAFRIAVGSLRSAPSSFTDARFGRGAALVFGIANLLFYLNVRSRRLGRQLVAVATPDAAV